MPISRKFFCLFQIVAVFSTVCTVYGLSPMINDDFSTSANKVKRDFRNTGKGFFDGVLPENWKENFASWNKSYATSKLVSEGKDKFLRLEVKDIPAWGAPQFSRVLPKLKKGQYYRLRMTVRNCLDRKGGIVVRQVPAPYKSLWATKVGISPIWQEFNATFSLDAIPDTAVGLNLILDGKGYLDIKSLIVEEISKEEATNKQILDTCFYKNLQDRSCDNSNKKKGGRFTGVLPHPWNQDYCHWNSGVASASAVNMGTHYFLEIKVDKESPQFICPLPAIKGCDYRLSVYARNQTGEAVKLQLRQFSAPYTVVVSKEIPVADSWKLYRFDFSIDARLDKQMAMLMKFDSTGIFQIADMKLTRLAPGSASIVKRPDSSLKNYLRNTRFPLGLQSGWNYMRNITDGTIESDPTDMGPSGVPALKLDSPSGKRLGLESEPFNVANPSEPAFFSFDYKATGSYRAEIISENRVCGSLTLLPSKSWKRVKIGFNAPRNAMACAFQIHGQGTLWLDALRLSPDSDCTYKTQNECEVALALPKSELSASRILFADEKTLIKYYVSGKAEQVDLLLKVTDLYGESKEFRLPGVKCNSSGTFTINPPSSQRVLGQFRVEVQAFRKGMPVSPHNELVITRLQRPKYWGKDAPNSPFGTHALAFDVTLQALKAAGINNVRLHDAGTEYTGWFHLEPEKGKWCYRDDEIMKYRRNYLRIFAQLGTAPKWASYLSKVDTGRKHASYHDRYFQPLDLNDFRNYVRKVAKHYKGVIDEWFVWNEPWNIAWWAVDYNKKSQVNDGYITSGNPQLDFALLNKTAYDAVKEVNPSALVAGTWTKGLPDDFSVPPYDIIDFHFYTDRAMGYPGDSATKIYHEKIGNASESINNGSKIPSVYMTEGQGASLPGISGDTSLRYAGIYHYTVPWDNQEDYNSIADRNMRFLLSFLSFGIKKVFFYSTHTYASLAKAPNFLVMFCADGYPHPMLAAHSAFALRIEDKKFITVKKLTPDLWAYLFSDGNKSVAVISGKQSGSGTTISCNLPNASASDLYGNRLPLPFTTGKYICYIEAPVNASLLSNALTLP